AVFMNDVSICSFSARMLWLPFRIVWLQKNLLSGIMMLWLPCLQHAGAATASDRDSPAQEMPVPVLGKASSSQIIVCQRAHRIDIYMKGSNAQSDRWLR